MWLDEERPVSKRELLLDKPFVNASGTLGFAPGPRLAPALSGFGAFITNPISRAPRVPASNRAVIPFPGGFLLHSGHPNPGITRVISHFRRRWAAAPLPVIAHLLVETPAALSEMVPKLEGIENILAVELGLPPDCPPDLLAALFEAGYGELPLLPCVSPEQVPVLLEILAGLAPAAVHLVEPRGVLPDRDGTIIPGRLYGPAIFPVMLRAARSLVSAGLRVIANGGVTARWQLDTLMEMGVLAVGLGSALWGIDQGEGLLSAES